MLRECARYEALAKIMIYSDDFYNFFRYVEVSTFDIASDAFSTFKVRHGLQQEACRITYVWEIFKYYFFSFTIYLIKYISEILLFFVQYLLHYKYVILFFCFLAMIQSNNLRLFIQELLTRHKILSAEFLEIHYDKVFSHYQRLLNSENYVTRRQSLKLLGELLLDRHNFTVSILRCCQ